MGKLFSSVFESNLCIIFLFGVLSGSSVVWGIQHVRIQHLQQQYESFIEQVKLQGEIQQKIVENKI